MSKTGIPCAPCKADGKRPKYETLTLLEFDPQRVLAGEMPLIAGRRLSAEMVAAYVWEYGGFDNAEVVAYDVTRPQQIMVCWWAGLYGPRSWKRRLGVWAEAAGHHLWYGCVNVPPLPSPEPKR